MSLQTSAFIQLYRRSVDSLLMPGSIQELIREIRARNLSYLPERKLAKLAKIALANEKRGVSGEIIEAGCALGGSSILLAASKSRDRRLTVYDVFSMIPEPTEEDGADVRQRYDEISSGGSSGIGGDSYYGYRDDLYEYVANNLALFGYPPERCRVELVKGLVQDTLSVTGSVSLAHIDVDWYAPVRVCLERIVPRLSASATIVIDDYFDWSGCHKAVEEYFRDKSAMFHFDDTAGSLAITRK